MNLITWVFVGVLSGGLASFVLRINESSNLQINLIVGVVGAIVAGIFVTPLFGITTINQRIFSFPSMFVSLGGALILIMVVYFFRRARANANE